MGAIVKSVGLRIRINSSKDEYFENSVDEAPKALKISGYNYQKTKKELLKFKSLDPIELINREKVLWNVPKKGVKAFSVAKQLLS